MSQTTASARPTMRTAAALLVAASLVVTVCMVLFWGAPGIGAAIWRALPVLPAALAVHGTQLAISGYGWWVLLPEPRGRLLLILRVRWVREALNTVLPLAGLGGAVGATRLLARDTGISMATATASTTGDLTCEAISQAPFLIMSLATVALLAPGQLTWGRAVLAVLPLTVGAGGFIAAQRMGMMRLIERAARRLGFGSAMAGLHDGIMSLHARPGPVSASIVVHFIAWALGGAEVWVILRAVGHPVAPAAAFAIEGLGMAARSMGFALPSGLAAQEAGFVLAGAALGVPAADAVALSMVKRLRELIVAVAGVIVWRIALWRPAPRP